MPENELAVGVAITVYCLSFKFKLTEWLYQSIRGLCFANQNIPKITGLFNLGTTQNLTATGVVSGENYIKKMAIFQEITLDLLESLTCKGLPTASP